LGRNETVVLVLLLVLSAAIWAFVRVASGVTAGKTTAFDDWAITALRRADDPGRPIGPAWLKEVARDISALGGVTFLSLLVATVAGFLWLRRMHSAMLFVTASTVGGLLLSQALKGHFQRPRPELVPHLAEIYSSSFPSGHAMLSATVFLTLGALLGRFVREPGMRAYFLIIAGGLTFLVGASRVYVGVHYPTDVLAGWTAGLAWALVCWLVARTMQQRGLIQESLTRGRPAGDESSVP